MEKKEREERKVSRSTGRIIKQVLPVSASCLAAVPVPLGPPVPGTRRGRMTVVLLIHRYIFGTKQAFGVILMCVSSPEHVFSGPRSPQVVKIMKKCA